MAQVVSGEGSIQLLPEWTRYKPELGFWPAAEGRVSPTKELGAAPAAGRSEEDPNPAGRPEDDGGEEIELEKLQDR